MTQISLWNIFRCQAVSCASVRNANLSAWHFVSTSSISFLKGNRRLLPSYVLNATWIKRASDDQRGYTLLETVVAMAIFVGVLIPLIATLGNFMLDGTTSQTRSALREVQTEMTQTINQRTFTDTTRTTDQGLIVKRKTLQSGNLIEIDVGIASRKKPETTILRLSKSVLSY